MSWSRITASNTTSLSSRSLCEAYLSAPWYVITATITTSLSERSLDEAYLSALPFSVTAAITISLSLHRSSEAYASASPFSCLDWELMRALSDVSIKAYPFNSALEKRLVKVSPADNVPDERVAYDDAYEVDPYAVREIKYTTRVMLPTRKRRADEMENPSSPFLFTYETTTDGSVLVDDRVYSADKLDLAKKYAAELRADAEMEPGEAARNKQYGAVMHEFIDAAPLIGDPKDKQCIFVFKDDSGDGEKCPYDVKVASDGEVQSPFCSMCLIMVEKARAAREAAAASAQ